MKILAYLEDDVLLEDMLDSSNNVFRLAFGELDRSKRALENGTIRCQLGHLGELLGIKILGVCRCGRCCRNAGLLL